MSAEPLKKYQEGHRKRACEKLINNGVDSLYDYEIVELLLFLIFKRKDVKPLAKKLLERFNTIYEILNASEEELLEIKGIGKSTITAIKIINSVFIAALKSKIIKKNHINCFEDVINYCKLNMKHLVSEELRVLFLNSINEILADEVLQKGDIDSVDIYPRNITKRSLDFGAKGVILIHNHPSGDPTPSANDIYTTNLIQKALKIFDIKLQDHIIIGGDRFISFSALNLINN